MLESLKNIKYKLLLLGLVSLLQTREKDRHTGDHKKYFEANQANLTTLEIFIKRHGWPSEEKMTKAGLSKEDALTIETCAFLCAQHADCNIKPIEFSHKGNWQELLADIVKRQQDILDIMTKQGASKGFTTYLSDRIARNTQKPQKFFTQYELYPGGKREVKIDNKTYSDTYLNKNKELREKLIEQRKKAGLEEKEPWFISNKHEPLQFLPEGLLNSFYDGKMQTDLANYNLLDSLDLPDKPSAKLEKTFTEKMQSKTPKGFHEV